MDVPVDIAMQGIAQNRAVFNSKGEEVGIAADVVIGSSPREGEGDAIGKVDDGR